MADVHAPLLMRVAEHCLRSRLTYGSAVALGRRKSGPGALSGICHTFDVFCSVEPHYCPPFMFSSRPRIFRLRTCV